METAEKLITENLNVWTSAVKAKSSAGRVSSNKRELYGITKLRGLILELAIRGLLAPQDSDDEPVSDALFRIASEKNRLVADGAIRKQKSSEITSDETPFKLPEGWQWVRLCEIAYPQAGFAFKSKNFNESELGLPLIRIRDVGQPFSGTFYDGDFREEFVIDNGDYLISMDGNFRVSPWDHGKALLNQRVSRLIFYGHEHSEKFCAISLQLRLSELQGVKAYTTVDHLSGKQISNSIIAFPPLAEQHRIVAKVDELMALCDQLELEQESSLETHDTLVATLLSALTTATADASQFAEAWQRIQANFDTLFTTKSSIDQLKQTILQLAVMGKLVPQDPQDEAAIQLQSSVSSAALPKISLPDNWLPLTLADCAEEGTKISYGVLKPGAHFDDGVPLVKSQHIRDGFVRTDLDFKISRDLDEKYQRTRLSGGEILLNLVGASIGRCAIAPVEYLGANVSRAVAVIRVNHSLSSDFLLIAMSALFTKENIRTWSSGSAQPVLNLGRINSLEIGVPPLAEQHRIVAKVDELMALCDHLKASLATAKTTQLNLADSLVEQAIG